MAASMGPRHPAGGDETVPLFGTWPRIYAAVVVCAIAVMALVGLFSAFPW